MQLLLVREPVASGAVIWFGQYPEEAIELDVVRPFTALPDSRSCATSGALAVDANLIFTDLSYRVWSTPLKPSWHTFWLDIARHNFRQNWRSRAEIITLAPAPELLPIEPPRPALHPLPLPAPVPVAAVAEFVDIGTPYSKVLADLKQIGPWSSLKKLAKLLGSSHTQLGRILNEGALPSDELAPRLDDLHRFAKRLARLTHGDAIVTKRLLTTKRERDQRSANDFLESYDYRNAFRAVMEAASPRPEVAVVEAVPRRWYDEPSRDLYDDEVVPEE